MWPVRGSVVRRFVAPACPRCAGHRGVDIAVEAGSPVRTVAAGTITFAGDVARRTYVVQRLGSGALVTYGWMASVDPVVTKGAIVGRGMVLGTTGRIFYLGVRVGGRPVEPLRALGFSAPRLVGPGGVRSAEVGRRGPNR